MPDNNRKLTILTPTYNRAELLESLYESLCNQTCKNFQWLVIDDGSTDSTGKVLKKFISQNRIEIDYKVKNNGGKHTALNYSHKYISGEYIVIVDSDDTLTANAVELILNKWEKYSCNRNIAGITFQKGWKASNEPFDPNIKGEYISDFATETNKGMHGDHCETIRTDLFIKFLFPEYQDERFIAEGAMWYSITKGYKVVYCDEIIYLAEYLENGLTRTGRLLHIKNPKGCMWHASVFLNSDFSLKTRIKNALLYICYAIFQKKDKRSVIDNLNEGKRIVCITWPGGWLLHKYWKLKFKNDK